jgi:DNA-binding protein H-NS
LETEKANPFVKTYHAAYTSIVFQQESRMAAMNLRNMGVDELLSLRAQIDNQLAQKQRELRDTLSRLDSRLTAVPSKAGRKSSPLKGGTVAPKYRSPEGETWAGRGARPRWLSALLKQGRKVEEFLIDKAPKASRKAATKRGRRKAA